MGNFFKGSHDQTSYTLLDPEQQKLLAPLSSRFNQIAQRDPFSLEGAQQIFDQNYLQPAIHGFNREGGTRDQIQAGFAQQGGVLSSRRESTLGSAYSNLQSQAQADFGRALPGLLGLGFQGLGLANQFLGVRTKENVIQEQPSLFNQISAGVQGIGSIVGMIAGA